MKKKLLLLTFDYELFLGTRSGSVDKCIITPTNYILQLLNKYNCKAIFFVDTTYLIKLKEHIHREAVKTDYHKIAAQLIEIAQAGHYIFPHLHPHWKNAAYIETINQWNLSDYKYYRFNSLPVNEQESVFENSVNILKEILNPVKQELLIDGYRAGGWSLQPFSDFEPLFRKHGIKYEFSVLRDKKQHTHAQHFDFTSTPANNIYTFSTDVMVASPGDFTEFVISVINFKNFAWINLLSRIFLRFIPKNVKQTMGDGLAINASQKLDENNVNLTKDKSEMVSIELLTTVKYPFFIKYIRNNELTHFVSHPKMLSKYSLKLFGNLLGKISKEYVLETDFRKMIT